MKAMKLVTLVAFLSVATPPDLNVQAQQAGATAQQKFSSLPIGANLDGYVHSVQILVVGGGLNASAWKSYPYSRKYDGKLEAFAAQKLREYTTSIQPVNETAVYGWAINAVTEGIGGLLPTYNGESKPATIAFAPPIGENGGFRFTLRNGKWEVPEEVFGKVKFQWGGLISYYIPNIWNLKVDLFSGSRVSRFAARERISDADNPCELPVILLGLNIGEVAIPPEIALAKPSWWERAEITLYTKSEFVTFLVNRTPDDGKAIRWSNPPPNFFVPPLPKIAALKRVFSEVTEILVEGTPNTSVVVEWTEQLSGEWQSLSALVVPLALNANGRGILTHKSTDATGFYRVRPADSSSPQ